MNDGDLFDGPDAPHVTVPCSTPGCDWAFFVAKDDPRLPSGPFTCPACSGSTLSGAPKNLDPNAPQRYELAVTCDRCGARLAVEAPSTREAWKLLKRERARDKNRQLG